MLILSFATWVNGLVIYDMYLDQDSGSGSISNMVKSHKTHGRISLNTFSGSMSWTVKQMLGFRRHPEQNWILTLHPGNSSVTGSSCILIT